MNSSRQVTEQILEIIPFFARNLAADLRRLGALPNPSHFGIMILLAESSLNVSELAERQGVSLPTMSATVSTLENYGIVNRSRDEADRRVVRVSLTEKGSRQLKDVRAHAEDHLHSMITGLPEEQLKKLADALQILQQLFYQGSR